MKTIKIAMLSFGDIDNYGDIFFSLIFQDEIKKRIRNSIIDFFAPYGGNFSGIDYKKFDIQILSNYDAVILAGGEVIHNKNIKTWDPIYSKRNMTLLDNNYSDIVWKINNIKAPFKAFFSVGVLPFENEIERGWINTIINELDYFSARGILSKKIIENELKYNERIHITPDLGWLFYSYLNKVNSELSIQYPSNYFIFQINSINENEEVKIAEQINRFLQENEEIECVLLPIIKPWDDFKYLQSIFRLIKRKDRVKLMDYLDVIKTGKIIVNSKFVIGSSLHSAITAMSASIPVGLINKWPGTKLQDLFFMQFKDDLLTNNIENLYQFCCNLNDLSRNDRKIDQFYSEFMKLRLEKAFDNLSYLILKKVN